MENRCRLCLFHNDEMIDVGSESGEKMEMRNIIQKHFGFDILEMNENKNEQRSVCLDCWKKIETFHIFYKRVIEAQTIQTTDSLCLEDKNDVKNAALLVDVEALESGEANHCQGQSFEIKEENAGEANDEEYKGSGDEGDKSSIESFIPLVELQRSCSIVNRRKRGRRKASIRKIAVKRIKKPEQDEDAKGQAVKDRENLELIELFYKLQCDICDEIFASFVSLDCHFKERHNCERYLKCCGKKFSRRWTLADHARWHTDPELFKCKICSKEKIFNSTQNLERHMLKHQPKNIFHCDQCPKIYYERSKLNSHIRYTHSSAINTNEQNFKCDECDKSFATKQRLREHLKAMHLSKERKHMCEICAKQFVYRSKYEVHMNKVHLQQETPKEECPVCGKWLKNLRLHVKIHKESELEHRCDICGKVSSSSRALDAHKRGVHFRKFDYECTMCEKTFKRAISLKEHMAAHTGDVLYSCPYCTKTFNSKANMWSHRKKVHPVEWMEEQRKRLEEAYKPT